MNLKALAAGCMLLTMSTGFAHASTRLVLEGSIQQQLLEVEPDSEVFVADRGRNAVERCIGWLKGCRRVATRYEKLATHFLAVVTLAMIQRCLRLLDPSNRT